MVRVLTPGKLGICSRHKALSAKVSIGRRSGSTKIAIMFACVRPRKLTDKSRIIGLPYCSLSWLSTLSISCSTFLAVSSVACSEDAKFISISMRGKSCGILGLGTNLTKPPANIPALTISKHIKPTITV